MKITLGYVFLFVTKGYFCSILISNIIFVFLSFVDCLCFFFSTTIKTLFSYYSLMRTPLFVLYEIQLPEALFEKLPKDFPIIRMKVIRRTFIVSESMKSYI